MIHYLSLMKLSIGDVLVPTGKGREKNVAYVVMTDLAPESGKKFLAVDMFCFRSRVTTSIPLGVILLLIKNHMYTVIQSE